MAKRLMKDYSCLKDGLNGAYIFNSDKEVIAYIQFVSSKSNEVDKFLNEFSYYDNTTADV